MNIKVSNILNYISEKSILEMGKEQLDRRLADGSIAKHPLIAVLDDYICQEESKAAKK